MAIPKATPKARLFQIYPFGKGLTFNTESVPSPPAEDAVPGSTSYFTLNHAVTFRCTLSLPDGSHVVSELFQRKKDAEHDASQKALNQMCVQEVPTLDVLTVEERWENLRRRIVETFSDKNVLSYMPLREHFKMSVRRKGPRYGQVPITAIAALDAKIHTLCKVIDRKSETDPVYAVALICEAASKCSSAKLDIENLCISRIEPFKPEVEQELRVRKLEVNKDAPESNGQQERDDALRFLAVRIPSRADKAVCSSQVVVQNDEYYMDVLAEKIGLQDGRRLVMSRPIGKTHPALRLYWAVPMRLPKVRGLHSDLVRLTGEETVDSAKDHEDLRRYSVKQEEVESCELKKNVRASLLMGYPVYGDVLLAAVGGDWRSMKAYSLDVPLSFYYRLLFGKFPQGNYKLSRGAVLASNLPSSFSSRLQWRGMSPRGLLIEFCQQHRLSEPVFEISSPGLEGKVPGLSELTELDETSNSKLGEIENEHMSENGCSKNDDDANAIALHGGPFTGTVRVELVKGSSIDFGSDGPYRNRHDAIQSCALKALHSFRPWFERCLNESYEPVIPVKAMPDMNVDLLRLKHDEVVTAKTGVCWETSDQEFFEGDMAVDSFQTDQTPPPGAIVTIRYSVRWLRDADQLTQSSNVLLEKKEDFTFELGIGAVIGQLDSMVAVMPVGQTACFFTSAPPPTMFFAAAGDLASEGGLSIPGAGKMKYTVQLLKYNEPPEERMEAALFKPSLSKQRLGCALSIIQNLQAQSLIDLGCGSGSLMENLLEEPTGLVELIGVDISSKSLVRAAKVLSAKLIEDQPGKEKLETIKLYEGSIADFNPDMRGIDVAVCIEVVEHMDPEPLSKFGSTVLGKLHPRVLIVSTPNFEYNPILQGLDWDPLTNSLKGTRDNIVKNADERTRAGSSLDATLGGSTEKRVEDRVREISNSESALGASMEKRIRLSEGNGVAVNGSCKDRVPQQVVKFRNEDHRFEWTRAEFRDWAMTNAKDYKYNVTFDGVGGSGEDEGPGYASQIAIFTQRIPSPMQVKLDGNSGRNVIEESSLHHHKIVWQWMPV